MFTGIIEGQGTIARIESTGQGSRVAIDADFPLEQTKIGDSLAVNGACLTAVRIDTNRFHVDISPETLAISTLSDIRINDRINIERAMRLSDRLDGHLVSGHIDGTGKLTNVTRKGNAIILYFSVAEKLAGYMIQKGSVAVDGVSLTINKCDSNGFEVSIIPHTAGLTTLNRLKTGSIVNIETDMIGKYIERFVCGNTANVEDKKKSGQAINMDFLARTGFLNMGR
ncbi:riboflavin synthase [Desulfobacterales bacterium HSG16]|nr:riboflavin synthase [Desulfobacterales bacterium HSG16]